MSLQFVQSFKEANCVHWESSLCDILFIITSMYEYDTFDNTNFGKIPLFKRVSSRK